MTHHCIVGLGTAAAYAQVQGLEDDNEKLRDATKDIYVGDEFMTKMAMTAVNAKAEEA